MKRTSSIVRGSIAGASFCIVFVIGMVPAVHGQVLQCNTAPICESVGQGQSGCGGVKTSACSCPSGQAPSCVDNGNDLRCGGESCGNAQSCTCDLSGPPACSSDADCGPNNACQSTTCYNPGTPSAFCGPTVGNPPPSNYNQSCSSVSGPNACGQTQSCGTGTIQCNGSCSVPVTCSPPPNPPNYGQSCSSAPNSCGMTNTGTYTCSGNCSASIPSESLCKAPPSCTFTGSPLLVVPPQQATLSWNCSNVATCTINGTPVTPAVKGSIRVSPTTNTTYTLSCSGAGSTTSQSVTVMVRGSRLQETNP